MFLKIILAVIWGKDYKGTKVEAGKPIAHFPSANNSKVNNDSKLGARATWISEILSQCNQQYLVKAYVGGKGERSQR